MYFGAIADDVTGGTDLASVLRQGGLRVIQTLDVPGVAMPRCDAVVISLKSRTAPVSIATATSVAAASFLRDAGAEQTYFKYCSTFDSTDEGNIGPVIEALMDLLGVSFTIACPAYPQLRRTVYLGHLFVGHQLLSESSMRHHPLTPMSDANLVRVLGRQCRLPIGSLMTPDVDAGVDAVRARLKSLQAKGPCIIVADALLDRHIDVLGSACEDHRFLTGGAALGGAVAKARRRLTANSCVETDVEMFPHSEGPVAILSGSCSASTIEQLRNVAGLVAGRFVDPLRIAENGATLTSTIDWACDQTRRGNVLLYSTANPDTLEETHKVLGRETAAALLDSAFAQVAIALAETGVRTFVVAGGETSGAVLGALGIRMLVFDDEIDPGVPWTYSLDPDGFALALKSGNFGSPDFFVKVLRKTL